MKMLKRADARMKAKLIETAASLAWKALPGYLKCLCCCGSDLDKIMRINRCCGCFIPEKARPLVEKVVQLLEPEISKHYSPLSPVS